LGGTTATGGLTTTAGGTTATTGRGGAAEAGALATTAPAGGFETMAGVAGVIIGGAGRGCGTILRGSGLAGAAGVAAATATTGGAGLAGAFGAAGATVRAGAWLLRASSSCSCFLARMAFITSPGLETCERSIFGAMVCEEREDPAPLDAPLVLRSNCARTFSASCSSIELEWVLPSPRPSSPNTSRICRLLTSISRARSLIRTLLIRLFSECAAQSP
jgi:hypothetical protein